MRQAGFGVGLLILLTLSALLLPEPDIGGAVPPQGHQLESHVRYDTIGRSKRIVARTLPRAEAHNSAPGVQPRMLRGPHLGIRASQHVSEPPVANAIDLSTGLVAGAVSGPNGLRTFDGLDSTDNVVSLTPPDPQIAVGPGHVVELVNISGRITDKDGTEASTFELRDFFGLFPNTLIETDPKIIYDDLDDRFFATYVEYDFFEDGNIYLAVSDSSDPTAGWTVYVLGFGTVIPDYPGLGLSGDKVTISANLFNLNETYAGEFTVILQKSDLLAAEPLVNIATTGPNFNRFTVRPAHHLAAGNDQYATTWNLAVLNQLSVIKITGTPEAMNVVLTLSNVVTANQDTPPLSMTAGPGTIDSGDFRVLEAVWRSNSLWSASSAECIPPGDASVRSCAHLVEVSTAGVPSLAQDIIFGAPQEYYSWPAIRSDASENLHVVLSHTSASIFAEARVAGQRATDPANNMSGSCLLKAGEIVHTSTRWGDYLGAAVDPADPSRVWVVGQYAKDDGLQRWGTYIGELSFATGACNSPIATCLDTDIDALCNNVDVDDDNDGCTDVAEQMVAPGSEITGGLRDPLLFWDFYDTPNEANERDKAVAGADLFRVLGRFGVTGDPGIDPLSLPALTGYHTAFDRGGVVGANPWNLGAANGSIAATDVFNVLGQFAHVCA